MKETARIAKLFSDWYDGRPWTEIRLTNILQDITAEQAAGKLIKDTNTIWQLVQHCLGWRENVLQKLQGAQFVSPGDNYLSDPADVSQQAWNDLLNRLRQNENDWQIFLQNVTEEFLNEGYKPSDNKFTNYEVIHGILHHDNYHFGQILILKKLLAERNV